MLSLQGLEQGPRYRWADFCLFLGLDWELSFLQIQASARASLFPSFPEASGGVVFGIL